MVVEVITTCRGIGFIKFCTNTVLTDETRFCAKRSKESVARRSYWKEDISSLFFTQLGVEVVFRG